MPRALWRTLTVVFTMACADVSQDAPPDGGEADTAGAVAALPEPVAGLRAVLDSAREAFEARDATSALAFYRVATQRDSALAAAWFGVFMSQRALGDTAAADSAFRRARRLADAPLTGSTGPRR